MVYVMSFLALFLFADKLVAQNPTCHPEKQAGSQSHNMSSTYRHIDLST